MRRFKAEWTEAANREIQAWHVPEYRYATLRDATKLEKTTWAMRWFRSKLSIAHNRALQHPKSKVALNDVRTYAKHLAGLALYQMEHQR